MENNIRTLFGARVRQLRVESKVSQEDFANKTGIARSYMSKLERGLANPSLDAVAQLAEGLGVSVADLFHQGKAPRRARQPVLVPYASDGTHFDEALCRLTTGGYKVGEKYDEISFASYEDALAHLRSMGVAKWRRPTAKGGWGLVSAVAWREKPKP